MRLKKHRRHFRGVRVVRVPVPPLFKSCHKKNYDAEPFFLVLICTKSLVDWGFAPDPTGGAYSAPPDSLAGFKEPTSNGRGKGR